MPRSQRWGESERLMIKFYFKGENGLHIGLGLTPPNATRLLDGDPIVFKCSALGLTHKGLRDKWFCISYETKPGPRDLRKRLDVAFDLRLDYHVLTVQPSFECQVEWRDEIIDVLLFWADSEKECWQKFIDAGLIGVQTKVTHKGFAP